MSRTKFDLSKTKKRGQRHKHTYAYSKATVETCGSVDLLVSNLESQKKAEVKTGVSLTLSFANTEERDTAYRTLQQGTTHKHPSNGSSEGDKREGGQERWFAFRQFTGISGPVQGPAALPL
eukprot:gb/GEZN01028591.1/.p1 GENE.gb/GEZN01028591.1/~~gb/GEZN01028591.1/.p1  ORF type:complete len:121 (+),score=21.68 gb/GEZN01028591.1/:41-403(+)